MSTKYTCIIIDDEPSAIGLLTVIIGNLFSNIEIAATCTEWTEALKELQNGQFDLVLTDIEMPGKNGIELLKLLPNINSEIIFTTAHRDFTLEAFRLAATGYVLKPIEDDQLARAFNIAIQRIEHKKNPPHAQASSKSIIGIPGNKGIDYVNIDDILYMETMNKCTKVVTTKGDIISSYNIGKFKDQLPASRFYSVHRSYLINLYAVKKYLPTGVVVMSDSYEIPVSRNLRDDFLAQINMVGKL